MLAEKHKTDGNINFHILLLRPSGVIVRRKPKFAFYIKYRRIISFLIKLIIKRSFLMRTVEYFFVKFEWNLFVIETLWG